MSPEQRAPSKIRVAISAARKIAEDYGQDQVVVVTFDKRRGVTHVVTYGRTVEECEQAAFGGNKVKAALGWPESLQHAAPARVTRARARKAGGTP